MTVAACDDATVLKDTNFCSEVGIDFTNQQLRSRAAILYGKLLIIERAVRIARYLTCRTDKRWHTNRRQQASETRR